MAAGKIRHPYSASVPDDKKTFGERTLTKEEMLQVRERLSRPIGRYDAERASQLSGIPERTIRHWASDEVLIPDYADTPHQWSYRDLVLLRLVAWLRSKGMEPKWVAQRTRLVRELLQDSGSQITHLRSQGQSMVVGDEALDRVSGETLIPQVVAFISPWELFESLPGGRRRAYNGIDLVRPASRLTIVPWVMAGEPCVEGTRVPTSTLYALHHQRGLSVDKISHLYPAVPTEGVYQAIALEDKLRLKAA